MNTPSRRDRRAFPWPLDAWWSYRRKRFWLLVLLVVYTLVGFFLLPWIAKREVVSVLEAQFGLPVSLAQVRTNPWALTVEAEGFAINDAEDQVLVGFDRLFVNLQLSSLINRALTLREVTLERPHGRLVRDSDGFLNVQVLVPPGDSDVSEQAQEEPGQPLGLVIHELSISNGQIEVRDENLPSPFETEVGPVDISIRGLSTLPDRTGEQRVSIATASGTRLEWSGDIGLNPLSSSGTVNLRGPYVPMMYRYVESLLNFELVGGDIEGSFDYRLRLDPEAGLTADIQDVNWILRGAALEQADVDQARVRFVALPTIELQGGALAWPERAVNIDAVVITDPEIRVWRNPDGSLSVDQLLASTPESANGEAIGDTVADAGADAVLDAPSSTSDMPGEPWAVSLDRFRIEGLALELADRSLDEPGTIGLQNFNLDLENVSTEQGAQIPMSIDFAVASGGDVSAEGLLTVLPEVSLQADVSVNELVLDLAQPWIDSLANVNLDSGSFSATAELTVTPDSPLDLKAALKIPGFYLTDSGRGEKLLGWENLEVDQLSFSAAENRLEISTIDLDAPYARFRIAEDQTTNFGDLVVAQPAPDAAPAEESGVEAAPAADKAPAADIAPAAEGEVQGEAGPPAGALALAVGRINVSGGAADYSDLSLPLPFAAAISELNGRMSTISSVSSEPAEIALKGRVDEYGLVEIGGQIRPTDPSASTDISVQFRNVDMPRLTPYTTKFAGRKIDSGRLSLDLRYRLDGGRLAGDNSVRIEKLKLGEKVDYPGAVDLPLGLAVALLTGPDGSIKLDMPVTGNVDDPKFNIGGVVMKTFANLIGKLAASPFNLLGRLVGIDSEKLDRVEFRPGSAELAPPEQEKLTKLVEALRMRPNLAVSLRGVSDPEADDAALREIRLTAEVEAELDRLPADDGVMLAERRRRVLETLATERLGVDLRVVRDEHQRPEDPARPDDRLVLDQPAYLAALEQLLEAAEVVGQEDLDALAGERALAVQNALAGDKQIDPLRVKVLDPDAAKLDDGWIPMRMKVKAM